LLTTHTLCDLASAGRVKGLSLDQVKLAQDGSPRVICS